MFIAKPVDANSFTPQQHTRIFFDSMMQHGYLNFSKEDSNRISELLREYVVKLPVQKKPHVPNTEIALGIVFSRREVTEQDHPIFHKTAKERDRIRRAYANRVCEQYIHTIAYLNPRRIWQNPWFGMFKPSGISQKMLSDCLKRGSVRERKVKGRRKARRSRRANKMRVKGRNRTCPATVMFVCSGTTGFQNKKSKKEIQLVE